MKNIVFVRIDDRLIHGQVMTAWLKYANGNEVVIVDNDLEKDDFMKIMMQSLIPSHIKLNVLGVENAIKYLSEESGKERIFILCKTPGVLHELVENGVAIKQINLGGMGMKAGRKTLYKNISASEEENDVFRTLVKSGVKVSVQVVPTDKETDVSKFL